MQIFYTTNRFALNEFQQKISFALAKLLVVQKFYKIRK